METRFPTDRESRGESLSVQAEAPKRQSATMCWFSIAVHNTVATSHLGTFKIKLMKINFADFFLNEWNFNNKNLASQLHHLDFKGSTANTWLRHGQDTEKPPSQALRDGAMLTPACHTAVRKTWLHDYWTTTDDSHGQGGSLSTASQESTLLRNEIVMMSSLYPCKFHYNITQKDDARSWFFLEHPTWVYWANF